MSLTVLDASVLTAFYAADDPRRHQVAARLSAGSSLFAPAHLDVEVVSALRGIARRSPVLRAAVPTALSHLASLPERLACPLLTCDGKLARATGLRCEIELIS